MKYQVMESTRMQGSRILISSCTRTQSKLLELGSNWENKGHRKTFHEFSVYFNPVELLELREAGGPPVNFPSGQFSFCQVFLCPWDLSTLFHFPLLLGSSSSSTEFPTPSSWNIIPWFLLFPLLSSLSSSAVLNFLEKGKTTFQTT